MTSRTRKTPRKTIAMVAAATMTAATLAACGSSNDETGATASQPGGGGSSAKGNGKTITIGYIDWDEDIAATHLWKKVLEDKGYKVNMQHVSDAGPVYVGLSKGQIDLFLDSWLPVTHKKYWEQYGNQLSKLNTWYTNAKLTIAVPNYMKIDSIDQLPSVKNDINGKIVGIEPGAGLTGAVNDAIKKYPLDGITQQTSSTPAMLAALDKATNSKDPIAVALWRPHWAYSKYPIKDLKDPKNVMGSAEQIHAVGTKDFASKFPEVAAMLKKWKMDDKTLSALENEVLQKNKDNPQAGVDAWLKANPDWVKSLG